jgi:membrane-bound inhibitor of C-type lysozyme
MNNLRTNLIGFAIIVLVIIGAIVFARSTPSSKPPLATVGYVCKDNKSLTATYYAGDNKPAATADEPPVPSGSVIVALSDGRTLDLPQTLSADGTRYANADESFVFWSKGNGALVLEDNQEKSYIGCIRVAAIPEGSDLVRVYANSGNGFSIRLPEGYAVDESYRYQAFGPGKEIVGIKFTIPESAATGTNLSSDTYISVEGIPATPTCQAKLFLDGVTTDEVVTDGDVTYSVASSTGAAAGNRYEETVYALPGTNPCISVRYLVHYGVIGNYPAGTVHEFDAAALRAQMDAIRRTLVVVQ